MKIALLLLQLVPLITQLIAIVEKIIVGPNQGPNKKKAVLASLEALMAPMVSASLISKTDIGPIGSAVSGIIDAAVELVNSGPVRPS